MKLEAGKSDFTYQASSCKPGAQPEGPRWVLDPGERAGQVVREANPPKRLAKNPL